MTSPPATSADWMPLLQAQRWRLESATDATGRPIAALAPRADRPLLLSFEPEGRLGVRGGCNQMSGAYTVSDGGALAVSQLMSTRMACAPALMQVDATLSSLLAQPVQLALVAASAAEAPKLRLTTANQTALVFVGQPTSETRYGGPATLVFMEVAARQVACSHPLIPNARCLQVRERSYDAQGRSTGTPGPWQPLYGEIEGYTHTEGVRNVLRVKRFQRAGPVPADASATVLVLDLVVETEATPS
ncbi:META and DUF4377 domain-containing protein [Rhodoferax koreensis]|nr:META and DUF4377 domain-containing protein [Rhodoferax koreense]